MRAVGVFEFGGSEVLRVINLPDPEPGAGEVVVRVHAATVNPTDIMTRNGARAELLRADGDGPYLMGMEAAGEVAAIGESADTDLRRGDRVMAIVVPKGAYGAYAELVAVPAESVVRSPAGVTDAEAATLPMNGLTARMALDTLHLKRGSVVAITGAAGTLGGYLIQLARADGLTVVADASQADEGLVKGLGADFVVRRGDDVARRIRQVIVSGVDGLADAALLGDKVIPAVRDGGKVVTLRGYRGPEVPVREITFHPILVRNYFKEHEKLDRLRQQVEAGQVTLRVARTFPAQDAALAHRLLEAGGVRGRLVLEF